MSRPVDWPGPIEFKIAALAALASAVLAAPVVDVLYHRLFNRKVKVAPPLQPVAASHSTVYNNDSCPPRTNATLSIILMRFFSSRYLAMFAELMPAPFVA